MCVFQQQTVSFTLSSSEQFFPACHFLEKPNFTFAVGFLPAHPSCVPLLTCQRDPGFAVCLRVHPGGESAPLA